MRTKVILVVFDGCRPDALAQAHTPHVDALWRSGAYTWAARSVMPSITLPTHTTMFRGVAPDKHGIYDNTFRPSAANFPSMMDVARRARLHTAMFYSWEPLRDLSAHGSLIMSYCLNGEAIPDADQRVAAEAARYLVEKQPDLTLVYLGNTDIAGHAHGWMSAPYLAAVEGADRALGVVLAALDGAGLRDHFTILLLADHGGHDYGHGTDSAEDMTIPWIINGTPIKTGPDGAGYALPGPVCILDTAATILHLLDLPRPESWDSRPILDALRD